MTRDEKIQNFLSDQLVATREALKLFERAEPIPEPEPEDNWERFIHAVAADMDIPNNVKLVCVAQAIQETGRGESELCRRYNNYHGMKWREEMKRYAVAVDYRTNSEPSGSAVFCQFASITDGVSGYLCFLNRSPYNGWEEHQNDPEALIRDIGSTWATDPNYTNSVLGHFAEAAKLLGKYGWKIENISPGPSAPLAGIKIVLDPGHARSAQGANSRNRAFTEYSMNLIQAKYLYEFFKKFGASVEIFDPNPDTLSGVGRRAKGKTLYISLHHNAANADGYDEGTETFVAVDASYVCARFAKRVNDAVVARIGSRNRGVKVKDFTVIATATSVGCPFAILVESYFIDDYSNIGTATKRSTEAAKGIGEAVLEWFK